MSLGREAIGGGRCWPQSKWPTHPQLLPGLRSPWAEARSRWSILQAIQPFLITKLNSSCLNTWDVHMQRPGGHPPKHMPECSQPPRPCCLSRGVGSSWRAVLTAVGQGAAEDCFRQQAPWGSTRGAVHEAIFAVAAETKVTASLRRTPRLPQGALPTPAGLPSHHPCETQLLTTLQNKRATRTFWSPNSMASSPGNTKSSGVPGFQPVAGWLGKAIISLSLKFVLKKPGLPA